MDSRLRGNDFLEVDLLQGQCKGSSSIPPDQDQLLPHLPDRPRFDRLASQFDAVPVYRRLLCDSLTPVSAFRRIDTGGEACLFESVVGGEVVGRYSFLAAEPKMRITARRNRVEIHRGEAMETREAGNPLLELKRLIEQVQVAKLDELPPFTGGAIGHVGYDAVRYVENLPDAPEDDRNLDDMSFAFYDSMLVFDNISKTLTVIALAWPDQHGSIDEAFDHAAAQVDELVARLLVSDSDLPPTDAICEPANEPQYESNVTEQQFEQSVEKCKQYIVDGDIFQVVISQRLRVPIECDPFEVYRSLRVLNPSPFMFFVRNRQCTLVGSSPEIMCRVVDGQVTVRPLAGTRPRGSTAAEDRELEQELLSDEKERAEHVMLVDLGRNDVGRVASFKSIELPDLMVVERYSHVMHISSTVTGQLRSDCDAFDALMASLPAGTVSGAPKVRAMQIIDEIESHRRGPYAGAVGYFDYSQNMDTCIALRTIVVQGDTAYIQAGAGIVADSDPDLEYAETLNKARGMLRAIAAAHQRVNPTAL